MNEPRAQDFRYDVHRDRTRAYLPSKDKQSSRPSRHLHRGRYQEIKNTCVLYIFNSMTLKAKIPIYF